MLFHSLVDPAPARLRRPGRVALEGVADPDALAAAWQQVTDRTPVLRTAFAWEGGRRAAAGRAPPRHRARHPPGLEQPTRPASAAACKTCLARDRAPAWTSTTRAPDAAELIAAARRRRSCWCGRSTTWCSTAGALAQVFGEVFADYAALHCR